MKMVDVERKINNILQKFFIVGEFTSEIPVLEDLKRKLSHIGKGLGETKGME
jgi:hypothetical protein